MLVRLMDSNYEGARIYYFESPEGATLEYFQALCNRLMKEAARDLLEGRARRDYYQQWKGFIGYDVLVDEVAARLPEHGYQEVKFPTVSYFGGLIPRRAEDDEESILGDVLDAVIAHNDAVWNRPVRLHAEDGDEPESV